MQKRSTEYAGPKLKGRAMLSQIHSKSIFLITCSNKHIVNVLERRTLSHMITLHYGICIKVNVFSKCLLIKPLFYNHKHHALIRRKLILCSLCSINYRNDNVAYADYCRGR